MKRKGRGWEKDEVMSLERRREGKKSSFIVACKLGNQHHHSLSSLFLWETKLGKRELFVWTWPHGYIWEEVSNMFVLWLHFTFICFKFLLKRKRVCEKNLFCWKRLVKLDECASFFLFLLWIFFGIDPTTKENLLKFYQNFYTSFECKILPQWWWVG